MKALRRFLRLSGPDKRLLGRATLLLALEVVRLRLMPRRSVLRLQKAARRPAAARTSAVPLQRILWAVAASALGIPGATCLPQAAVAQRMLRAAGYATELHIGVSRDGAAGLKAHAWLEHQGTVLIGGEESPDSYIPLAAFGEAPHAGR